MNEDEKLVKEWLSDIKNTLADIRKLTKVKRNAVHTIYRNKEGQRVPSVTTFLGVLEKPELHSWFWEQGLAGLDCWATRDVAGDTGTLVHYLIHCMLTGEEPNLDEYSPEEIAATTCPMKKFEDWIGQHELSPILMETPLVSEEYQYGGMPDFYGKVDGVLTLLDYKTGKGVYQEAFYQVAAYKQLLEEHGHKVDDVRILRFGKSEDEGFEDAAAGKLDKHFEIFLACLKIYNLRKRIRQDAKAFVE